jgi:hypothetical protein
MPFQGLIGRFVMRLVSIAIASAVAVLSGCSVTVPSVDGGARDALHVRGVAARPRGEQRGTAGCVVAGDPRVLAHRARIRGGVEAMSWTDHLAVAYSVDPTHGVAMTLDPDSLSPLATSEHSSQAPIRHVAPTVAADSKLGCATDGDAGQDRMAMARTVSGPSPFAIGATQGRLVWSETASSELHDLWSIGSQQLDALHVVPLGDGKGYAVAFRQGDTIRLAALRGDRTVAGPLVTLAAPAAQGEMALAASDGVVMVTWSNRESPGSPASLTSSRWVPGQEPTTPRLFQARSEGDALSPTLAGIGGGSFLLVYTSRDGWDSRVVGQAIDAGGEPLGTPFTVSTDHAGAGWASTAVGEDGRGVAAFLAPAGSGFELMATPIVCPIAPEQAVAALAK